MDRADWVITFAGFIMTVALFVFEEFLPSRMFFFIPALLLIITFAPFIQRKRDDLSFWFYNRLTWFGVAVALIGSMLMFGGAAAAVGSVDYLFGVDIDGDVYAYLFSFAAIILGPLYALSWIPKKFNYTEEDCNDPPGLGFIVNWILAPLVIVYMAILYAYFAKILVTQDVPRGQLALMIAGFGGAGVITYLVAYAMRERGGAMLKLVMKYFFPALLIPVLMQAYSIFLRVEQYGMTEKRYIIIVAALWFAFLAIGFTLKRLPLRAITMSLCGLLLIASWGPLSAISVSVWDQSRRLDAVLQSNNLIEDGKLVKAKSDISFEDRKTISSIVEYLGQKEKTLYQFELERYGNTDVFNTLGFDFVPRYNRRGDEVSSEYLNYNFNGTRNQALRVTGYDYVLQHLNFYSGGEQTLEIGEGEVPVKLVSKKTEAGIQITIDDLDVFEFDVSNVLEDLRKNQFDSRSNTYTYEEESTGYRLKFRLQSLNARVKDGKTKLNNLNGQLFIDKK